MRTLSLTLALFITTAAVNAQTLSRITSSVDDTQRITLPGRVHPLANSRNDRGILPDDTPLTHLKVALKHSEAQIAALNQLMEAQQNPASPTFHQWLTPQEFGARFGPSDAEIATISSWLTAQGFTVTKLAPGRLTLEFTGNAGLVRQAFHTEIHQYATSTGLSIANATQPDIPQALAPVICTIIGLNNFPPEAPHTPPRPFTYNPRTRIAKPDWTIGSVGDEFYFLAPADFAVQYDVQPLYDQGFTGAGQTIAVVGLSNIDASIPASYRKTFGLSTNPVQVLLDGKDPGILTGSFAEEAYLDVELSGSVAPAAAIDLVVSDDYDILAAMNYIISNNLSPIISASVEECESSAQNLPISDLYQQAAAQGITILVASSDSGSAGCDNFDTEEYASDGLSVNGFAATEYNIAVGGTDFYFSNYADSSKLVPQLSTYWDQSPTGLPARSLKTAIPEQVWNDTQYGINADPAYASSTKTDIVAGSGGPSNCASSVGAGSTAVCVPYPKPSWQSADGVPNDSARDVPDISLFAANGRNFSAYPICFEACAIVDGKVQLFGVGGTSASTPAFAGIMALINQKYGRQGQAAYILYALANQFPASFHDVTVGTNTVPCNLVNNPETTQPPTDCIPVPNPLTIIDPTSGTSILEGAIGTGDTPLYNATAGYDLATGLGTIDANLLLTNWNKIADFDLLPETVNPVTAHTTLADRISLQASGLFSGKVSLTCDGTDGITCSLSPTAVGLTPGATGESIVTFDVSAASAEAVHTATVTGTDASLHIVHVALISITVPPNTFALTLKSQLAAIAAQGDTATGTIVVTPSSNFSGTVDFTCVMSGRPSAPLTAPPVCTVAPVTVSTGQPATTALKITTTAPVISHLTTSPKFRLRKIGEVTCVLLFIWFIAPARRRRQSTILLTLGMIFLVCTPVGCGSGSQSTPPQTTLPGTTLGTYTFLVTGTDAATGKITSQLSFQVTLN